MLQITTIDEPRNEVVREVTDSIHARVGRAVKDLNVACDGEVITVHGKVGTCHLWQLAFSAVRGVSNRLGGLLLDYQVQAIPVETAK